MCQGSQPATRDSCLTVTRNRFRTVEVIAPQASPNPTEAPCSVVDQVDLWTSRGRRKGGRIDAVQCDTTFVEFYPDDELSMLLGRVVRAGALTEMQVRNVYSTLVAGSLAVALKVGQIDHVTRAVEVMDDEGRSPRNPDRPLKARFERDLAAL